LPPLAGPSPPLRPRSPLAILPTQGARSQETMPQPLSRSTDYPQTSPPRCGNESRISSYRQLQVSKVAGATSSRPRPSAIEDEAVGEQCLRRHAEDDTNRHCPVTALLPADSSATMATILELRAGSHIANVNMFISMVHAAGQCPRRPLRNSRSPSVVPTHRHRQPALPSKTGRVCPGVWLDAHEMPYAPQLRR
jgi:hypothetical protein